MIPENDKRTVLTLDAGGTNLVFTALKGNKEIVDPITLPSNGDNLDTCLDTIESGFRQVMARMDDRPVAISFAFPGPSDLSTGIIGKLNNLPAFQGNVPLGPILENRFSMPVFINNDGNLYAYGEALSGFLPYINGLLSEAGVKRQFRNLIGLTLGTGFGGGIVLNQELLTGDNSMAGEIWMLRNRLNRSTHAEEGVSIRAIRRVYFEQSGLTPGEELSPKDIFDIAEGNRDGHTEAAKEAFRQLGVVLGDALANLLTTLDGAAVIGGGLTGARSLIFPAMFEEMNTQFTSYSNVSYPRLVQKVFNTCEDQELKEFLSWKEMTIPISGSNKNVSYYAESRLPIGISALGTSRAVSLGAYAFALKQLGPCK